MTDDCLNTVKRVYRIPGKVSTFVSAETMCYLILSGSASQGCFQASDWQVMTLVTWHINIEMPYDAQMQTGNGDMHS